MGGAVRFLNFPENGWISSMAVPFWEDLSHADKLELPRSGNLWYDRMMYQMDVYGKACKGKYGCSHLICICVLNLLFEQAGRKLIERLISYYDGAVIHVHANGYGHLLPYVSTIKNLKAIMLGDDPYNPRAIDVIDTILPQCGDVPVTLHTVPYLDFVDLLSKHKLPGNVLYYVSDVPSISAANRTMDKVREYRV